MLFHTSKSNYFTLSFTPQALALAGMRVVAVARRKDRLEELQTRVVGELGVAPGDFLPVVCDITKEAEVSHNRALLGLGIGWGMDRMRCGPVKHQSDV